MVPRSVCIRQCGFFIVSSIILFICRSVTYRDASAMDSMVKRRNILRSWFMLTEFVCIYLQEIDSMKEKLYIHIARWILYYGTATAAAVTCREYYSNRLFSSCRADLNLTSLHTWQWNSSFYAHSIDHWGNENLYKVSAVND